MSWEKPEDLSLVAECETLPELEVIKALLASAGISSTGVTSTDSTTVFAQKSIFGNLAKPLPYKLLVRNEDAETAREIISAVPEEPEEDK